MTDEVLSESKNDYFDLGTEDTWIEYLRTRLPYSFKRVEELAGGKGKRQFVLSEPVLLTGMSAPEYHNYWRRGNVYYMTGMLLDRADMHAVWKAYRSLECLRMLECEQSGRFYMPISNAYAFYNSIQMEKVWRFALDDHMDRERVVMTNVSQALELCLKAVQAHVEHLETNRFAFHAGHDVNRLYDSLPQELRDEIETESKAFGRAYSLFRTQAMQDLKIRQDSLHPSRHKSHEANLRAIGQDKSDWSRIAARINESSYTVFADNTDPGRSSAYTGEDWFERAMGEIKDSMYHRYAPEADRDVYPVETIHSGLMLGRFMYEHLFPVPLDPSWHPLTDGLTIPTFPEKHGE